MKKSVENEILKKVVDDYDSISSSFNDTRKMKWPEFDEYLKFIKDGDFVLDLACGNGRLCGFLNENCSVKYLGVDNSRKLLDLASKNFPDSEFKYGDLVSVPCDEGVIDVVCCIAAFHHLPSKNLRIRSLNEIFRILKKDGIFILSVWNLFRSGFRKYVLMSYLRAFYSFFKYSPRDCFIPWRRDVHIKRYYYAFFVGEMRKLLGDKFEVLKVVKGSNFVFICRKK